MFCSIRTRPQTCVLSFGALSISRERETVSLSSPGKSGCASYSDNSAQKWSRSFRAFRGEATRPSDSWLLQTGGGGAELGPARASFAQLMGLISLSYLTDVESTRGLSWACRGPGARHNGASGPALQN